MSHIEQAEQQANYKKDYGLWQMICAVTWMPVSIETIS